MSPKQKKQSLKILILNKNQYNVQHHISEEIIPFSLAGSILLQELKMVQQNRSIYNSISRNVQMKSRQSLILGELGFQVSSLIKEIVKYMKVECMVSTGGTDFRKDFYQLKQVVHVLFKNQRKNQAFYLSLQESTDLSILKQIYWMYHINIFLLILNHQLLKYYNLLLKKYKL